MKFEDSNIARRAAQHLVTAGFDAKRAGQLMDPSAPNPSALGRRMLASEEVKVEVNRILNRTERNAAKFSDLMWDWLESTPLDKDGAENKRTAARILAKGYINEKGPRSDDAKPALVITASNNEINNLTEPIDQKKVN